MKQTLKNIGHSFILLHCIVRNSRLSTMSPILQNVCFLILAKAQIVLHFSKKHGNLEQRLSKHLQFLKVLKNCFSLICSHQNKPHTCNVFATCFYFIELKFYSITGSQLHKIRSGSNVVQQISLRKKN